MLNVYSLTFNPYRENTYILVDAATKDAAVIDPGCSDYREQNELIQLIKDLQVNPVLLLNTHCHIDHVLGNKFIFDNFGLKPQYHRLEQQMIEMIPSYAMALLLPYETSPLPERYIDGGDVIALGEAELHCLFTPGHSPGSISFYSPEDKIVLGGDVLFNQSVGRTDLPGGDFDVLTNSILTRLFSLPDDVTVYPGHGDKTSIGFECRHNPFVKKL